jgi:hypothetical protein
MSLEPPQPRPRAEAHQEDRRNHRTHRCRRIRLLRVCGVEIGLKRLEARPTATVVHRLQNSGRIARKAGRQVGASQRGSRLKSSYQMKRAASAALFLLLRCLATAQAEAVAAPAVPAAAVAAAGTGGAPASCAAAFIDRRKRPLSSASRTLTRTCWPSFR